MKRCSPGSMRFSPEARLPAIDPLVRIRRRPPAPSSLFEPQANYYLPIFLRWEAHLPAVYAA